MINLLLAILFITTVCSVIVKLLGGDAGAFKTDIVRVGNCVPFSIKAYLPST